MAATMILGALLLVSVILTVSAWVSRGRAIAELNDLQDKFDAKQTSAVQDVRKNHHENIRMQTGVAPGCQRCLQLKRELDGTKAELINAYATMSDKQKDEVYYNYDIVAKNTSLVSVGDPSNPNLKLLQISFTVKNQSKEARGNTLGLFKLYKDKKQVWQKNFTVKTLKSNESTYVQFMAPGHVQWDAWFCKMYPSVPTGADGLPERR
jgi:hypothetical protein